MEEAKEINSETPVEEKTEPGNAENAAHGNKGDGGSDSGQAPVAKTFSLQERLAAHTEKKDPPRIQAPTPEETKKSSSSFWGSDDDDTATEDKPTDKPADKEDAKATDRAYEMSARTATMMFDNLQKTIFTPLINWKYSKKFTKEEYDKLDVISDLPESKVSPEDLPLHRRFDKVMKKRDKKAADIPLSETESKDMEAALLQYCKVTEKLLSPGWLIALQMSNSVAKRSIDLFTE